MSEILRWFVVPCDSANYQHYSVPQAWCKKHCAGQMTLMIKAQDMWCFDQEADAVAFQRAFPAK